jgi:hypothetical protein
MRTRPRGLPGRVHSFNVDPPETGTADAPNRRLGCLEVDAGRSDRVLMHRNGSCILKSPRCKLSVPFTKAIAHPGRRVERGFVMPRSTVATPDEIRHLSQFGTLAVTVADADLQERLRLVGGTCDMAFPVARGGLTRGLEQHRGHARRAETRGSCT